jgi:predicted Rossmann fold nucleotide-binding protein DprA/Smf involved in DNA uptake
MKKTQITQDASVVYIDSNAANYPSAFPRYLGHHSPPTICALGNLHILQGKKLGLFCSVRCPGNLILQTYDLARTLRDAGVTVIGGFHSPMEQECLRLLLRGKQPIVICPARSLNQMRIPAEWKQPIVDGRLLLLSPFGEKHRRATADLAHRRNEFVVALADEVLVAYAEEGGRTEAFAREVIGWGKPVFTLKDERNQVLMQYGAQPVDASSWIMKS